MSMCCRWVLSGIGQQEGAHCGSASWPHLDSKFGANALDGVAHVHMLVDGHDVRVTACHALQQAAAATNVEDDFQVRMCLHQYM